MESVRQIFPNWRNPNGIKPHVFDVLEIVLDSNPGSSAVFHLFKVVWTIISRSICPGKSVSKQLVD